MNSRAKKKIDFRIVFQKLEKARVDLGLHETSPELLSPEEAQAIDELRQIALDAEEPRVQMHTTS